MKDERNDVLFYFTGNLTEVFKIRKRILGKVDLQKSVYFMMRLGAPVPFRFRWNILGPYSYDLAHYIDHLAIEGLFKYNGTYQLDEKMAKSYESNLVSETREKTKNFFRKVEEMCNSRNYDSVLFMECLASLDFIQSNLQSRQNRKNATFNLLATLKPEKARLFKAFREDAWGMLNNEGLIK